MNQCDVSFRRALVRQSEQRDDARPGIKGTATRIAMWKAVSLAQQPSTATSVIISPIGRGSSQGLVIPAPPVPTMQTRAPQEVRDSLEERRVSLNALMKVRLASAE